MWASWLCCRGSPPLCSCSEWFPGQPHMSCLPGALQRWSAHPRLGPRYLYGQDIRQVKPRKARQCFLGNKILLQRAEQKGRFAEKKEKKTHRETSRQESSVTVSSQHLPEGGKNIWSIFSNTFGEGIMLMDMLDVAWILPWRVWWGWKCVPSVGRGRES